MIAWQYLQLALFGVILSWCKNGYVNAQNERASPKTSAGTPEDSSPLFLKPKSEIESSPKGDAAHQTLPCPGDGMVEIMDFSDPKYHVDAASSFALQEILQGNSPYDTDAFGVSIDSSEKVQLIIWSALAGTAIDKGTDLDLTLEILVKGSCTGAFRVVVHDREGQFTAQTWGDQIITCEQLTYAPTSAPTASTTKHPPVIEPGTNIARAPVTKGFKNGVNKSGADPVQGAPKAVLGLFGKTDNADGDRDPTSSPTFNPSLTPSAKPSAPPTSAPTNSKKPSTKPSSTPTTSLPSTPPSYIPTSQPSASEEPSKTKEPSSMPSSTPSKTSLPSTSPSYIPTSPPTEAKKPTLKPTSNPQTSPPIISPFFFSVKIPTINAPTSSAPIVSPVNKAPTLNQISTSNGFRSKKGKGFLKSKRGKGFQKKNQKAKGFFHKRNGKGKGFNKKKNKGKSFYPKRTPTSSPVNKVPPTNGYDGYLQASMASYPISSNTGVSGRISVYRTLNNGNFDLRITMTMVTNVGKGCPIGTTSTSCGVRILTSTTCTNITGGMDYYNPNLHNNPWSNVTYSSDATGTSNSSLYQHGGNGYGLRGNLGHAIVLYNEFGEAVACGMLYQHGIPRQKLNATLIPKFVEDLTIPSVLYDSNVSNNVEISMRQISQQVLPHGFPKTTLWAYGNPADPTTFSHPSGTVENIEWQTMTVTWRNELVLDPDKCREDPESAACNYLFHVIQDKYGVPIIDQTLHWAAPNQICASGEIRTDCKGASAEAYEGPIPITTHVHGAHVEYHSDGYPESWFLPSANNIPKGYATQGRYYSTNGAYSKSISETDGNGSENPRGIGSAVYIYDNSETSTTLWYHDHTLGITRLNVYAGGAGFWLIREKNGQDDFLEENQALPGPPPKYGQDPNSDNAVRKTIREIPLALQQMSFYSDGGLYYPANRVYQANSTCSDGDVFADTNGMPNIPFIPKNGSDLSPIWIPEAFFDTWVVNGKTWPRFEVAPERYRFRLLNAADSAALNIFLKTKNGMEELIIYVIGTEQGLLPIVIGVTTGNYTEYYETSDEIYYNKTYPFPSPKQALLIDPGERYDVVVDFTGYPNGTEILMYNTAPDGPFQGFDSPDYAPANNETTGQVMKFIINDELKNPKGDTSSLPWTIHMNARPPLQEASSIRDLFIAEQTSQVCVDNLSCDASPTQCDGTNSFGQVQAVLGYGRSNTSKPSMWSDPICMNPKNGSTEILQIWNWSPDAHPMHFHLVNFQLLGRYDIYQYDKQYNGKNAFHTGVEPLNTTFGYEFMKDVIIAYPNTITQIKATFDRPGLYVWHCHILSHEDNEMMLPFCVGERGVDCPEDLFVGSETFCAQP